jgi:Ser/Thr protein kinase RdoA (MazF antagonist)
MHGTGATAAFIAEQYGLGAHAALRAIARGATGRIWRLDTDRGSYAVKEPLWTRLPETDVAHEVAFRDAAAARGVLAPESLRTLAGRYVCALPEALGGGDVRVLSWVDGQAVHPGERDVDSWIGATLGHLHALRWSTVRGVEAFYDTCPPPQQWTQLLAQAHDARVDWAGPLAQRMALIEELSSRVRPADADQLILSHRDERPANVLRTRAGWTLLDWDNVGGNTADRVLASTLCQWHLHDGAFAPERVRGTMRAYAEAGAAATLTTSSSSTYLAGYLNYLVDQAQVALDPHRATELRVHATEQMRSWLAAPPDPRLIDRLLETAAST